ncbi:MAG: DUF1761 domain-containing protein [Mesorhizobium sp.]|nr:DUF1761 domain-containing protein [Mesorhizobium sp.]
MTAARINPAAVVIAGVTAFTFSLAWYSPLLFGSIWIDAKGAEATTMAPWKFFVAPLRELFTAWFLAWLIGRLGIADWKAAAGLGALLWAAFYVVQLAGAVIFDGMSPALGAVHAGDWLGKMLIMTIIVSAWRKRQAEAT